MPTKICLTSLFLSLNYLSLVACRNIVLIVTDDQDSVLDGMTPMTNTLNLVGRQGATFTNCFVASPICCPNRASILTGRYQHNHLTVNNSIAGGCSSAQWQRSREPATFAALLRNVAGYTTFYAGKYLNEYGNREVGGAAHVPMGWDWWAGLIGNSRYYDYSLSINGTERKYGDSPSDYLTDVISNLAVDFIKGYSGNQPFFMVLAPPAPHAPFTPADRHNGKYNSTKAKRTPNFNIPVHQDKHWLVRESPTPLPDNILPKLDEIYRKRWESLLAVDELVKNIHDLLEERSLLDDTYFIYTSDNGYHIGQFSMPMDKRQPYETDIRVPLLISGPGIEPSTISAPVSSVDIFATLLNIAGVEYPSDGTTLFNANHNLSGDRTVLIEYRGERSNKPSSSGCPSDSDLNVTGCAKEMACKCKDATNNTFSCIRRVSSNFNNVFCIFEDDQRFVEAYDMNVDEYQMTNIGYTMKKGLRHRFRKRLNRMVVCQDAQCVFTGPDTQSRMYMPVHVVDKSAKAPGRLPSSSSTSSSIYRWARLAASRRHHGRTTLPRGRSCPCPARASADAAAAVAAACSAPDDRLPSPSSQPRRRRCADAAPAAASGCGPAPPASASATWRDDS